jgi:hypothetical protein
MPHTVLYLDDSGQKEYPAEGTPFDHGVSRYFVFGGYYTTTREAGRLVEGLKAAKFKAFGTTAVEVKSNWLRLPLERERHYLKPFNIDDAQLNEFVHDFYSHALAADIALVACVVDKQHMVEDYQKTKWYTPAVAYEAIVQRLQNELGPRRQTFGVVIDDMTGKTPNHSEYRENLKRHHRQLQRTGGNFVSMPMDALTGDLRFVNSRDSNLVQVSDLIAYNVFRQFRDFGEEWEDLGLTQLPSYDWFRRIAPKFRCGPDGRIQGFGVIKFPLRVRVPWAGTLRQV